jgi:putative transposase
MPCHVWLDAPGTLHHIIARGIERRRIFFENTAPVKFLAYLEEPVNDTGTRMPAWLLFPEPVDLHTLLGQIFAATTFMKENSLLARGEKT